MITNLIENHLAALRDFSLATNAELSEALLNSSVELLLWLNEARQAPNREETRDRLRATQTELADALATKPH